MDGDVCRGMCAGTDMPECTCYVITLVISVVMEMNLKYLAGVEQRKAVREGPQGRGWSPEREQQFTRERRLSKRHQGAAWADASLEVTIE